MALFENIQRSDLLLAAFGFTLFLIAYPDGTAQAAAPGYKVSTVKSGLRGARSALEEGESPQQDCAMVSMQGKSILADHSDDADAVAVVEEAMEACGMEIPLAYFSVKLEAAFEALAKTPDAVEPCNDFVSEFSVYFSVAGSAPEGAPDPEERVKAALSERMHEVCPLAAGMLNF